MMQRILRVLLWVTYPFLALSGVLMGGMVGFGPAFIVDVTVENRTDRTILITPVGTFGAGSKAVLPMTMTRVFPLPAARGKAIRVDAGSSATFLYDWDDINFSEIVVEDEAGRALQYIVDLNPTANQYHAPRQEVYVIDNLATLAPIRADVREAVAAARSRPHSHWTFLALVVGPWLTYGGLCLWRNRSSAAPRSAAVSTTAPA